MSGSGLGLGSRFELRGLTTAADPRFETTGGAVEVGGEARRPQRDTSIGNGTCVLLCTSGRMQVLAGWGL
jgi:hypothetical protein